MYTATFYSYRGGVGRTTALVNVAVDLALRGRKVLLVDFDLEAPSLPSFPLLGRTHPGVVEFIDEYLHSGKPPAIADYIFAARDDVYPARLVGENGGKIWVMPAGRGDDDYWQAFHKIDWKKLYDLQDGFLLFEDMKFQWQQTFQPDYVLLDARAGINDRLAICTRQLPDALVTLFTPDSEEEDESDELAGVRRVLRDVVIESLQPNHRRIDVLTVATQASHLDSGDDGIPFPLPISMLPESWCLSIDPEEDDLCYIDFDHAATIPRAPELLLQRQVVANLCPRKRLPLAYRQLADALIRSNCSQDREGTQRFLNELQGDPDKAVAVPAIDWEASPFGFGQMHWFDRAARLDEVIKNFYQDAEILSQAASCLFLAGRYDEAMRTLDQAIDPAPAGDTLLWQRTPGRLGAKRRVLVRVALADSIHWQRASYRRHLNDPREVDDLWQLLESPKPSLSRGFDPTGLKREFGARTQGSHLPEFGSITLMPIPSDKGYSLTHVVPGVDSYVASAFHRLRLLAPDKMQEALHTARIQQLPPEARQRLIADEPLAPPSDKQEPLRLIRARKWRDAITLLEARISQSSSTSYLDLFFLAMAFWGAGNDARATELCCSVRELILEGSQVESILEELDTSNIEQIPLLSLSFWKAGDKVAAKCFLDRCDELLSVALEADAFFSIWRFRVVTRAQFETDCHSQRQMIKGAAIRPYFLRKEPGSG